MLLQIVLSNLVCLAFNLDLLCLSQRQFKYWPSIVILLWKNARVKQSGRTFLGAWPSYHVHMKPDLM